MDGVQERIINVDLGFNKMMIQPLRLDVLQIISYLKYYKYITYSNPLDNTKAFFQKV